MHGQQNIKKKKQSFVVFDWYKYIEMHGQQNVKKKKINFFCVWLIHHCIFIYVLNTSWWQTLKKKKIDTRSISHDPKTTELNARVYRISWGIEYVLPRN